MPANKRTAHPSPSTDRLRRMFESDLARPLILIVALFVVWDLAIRIFSIPPYLVPAPMAVAKQLVNEWPRLWREALVTGYATIGGFGLSILLGIPLAMAIAYSRVVESFVFQSGMLLEPLVELNDFERIGGCGESLGQERVGIESDGCDERIE